MRNLVSPVRQIGLGDVELVCAFKVSVAETNSRLSGGRDWLFMLYDQEPRLDWHA